MADQMGRGSLVDARPDLVVHIPEAGERPQAPPTVAETQPVPWIERREAPWVIVGVAVALIALLFLLLFLLRDTTTDVSAVPEAGDGGTAAVAPNAAPWAALAVPVPESYRTHTANVNGDVDVLAVAELGAAQSFVGSVATADGPMVQQIFGEQAFSISSPTGATVVAFVPYQASDAPIVGTGLEVTFVGTLMPVPDDFAVMVGTEAASIGERTGVYLSVVPETLGVVTPVSETS
jgi:hypothetical protein